MHVYSRAEIVNGTGFERNARFLLLRGDLNAEFVQHACDSYADLLDALKYALRLADLQGQARVVERMQQAIAKAEGRDAQ